MKQVLQLVLILSLFSSTAQPAYPCSCVCIGGKGCELKNTNAVFIGKVVEIDYVDNKEYPFRVKFEVEKYWRGANKPEIIVLTDQGIHSCHGVYFEKGKEYMGWAYKERGALITHGCTYSSEPTKERAQIILKELGEGKLPKAK